MTLEVLRDWLGSGGKPVFRIQAIARAHACTEGDGGEKCPYNIRGNWITRLKRPAARIIRRHLAAKAEMDLRIPQDKKLGFCKKCGCCLSLKVWTPAEHIMNHTDPDQLLTYPDFCWVRKELTGT